MDPAAAFEHFYRSRHQHLLSKAETLTGSRDEGEELAAHAWAEIWSRWSEISRAERPGRILALALSAAAKQRADNRAAEQALLHWLGHLADDTLIDEPDTAAVVDARLATRRLPRGQRICMVLRYAFDWTPREVADLLGTSASTVTTQARSGVAEVHRLLTTGSLRQDPPRRTLTFVILGTRQPRLPARR